MGLNHSFNKIIKENKENRQNLAHINAGQKIQMTILLTAKKLLLMD